MTKKKEKILYLKNIDKELYVETEFKGKVTYTKFKKNALTFRKDGDESESDAESTLALLNEQHEDCFSLIEC